MNILNKNVFLLRSHSWFWSSLNHSPISLKLAFHTLPRRTPWHLSNWVQSDAASNRRMDFLGIAGYKDHGQNIAEGSALRPRWCSHCKVVVLGSGVRKSLKDLPFLKQVQPGNEQTKRQRPITALPSACGLIQGGTFRHICCTNKKCQSCYLYKMNFSKSHKTGLIHGSFLNCAPNLFPWPLQGPLCAKSLLARQPHIAMSGNIATARIIVLFWSRNLT